MKIWVLVENTVCGEGLAGEHGLSLYIQTENRRILFDMGQTAAFADNARKLGLDLAEVDFAVLSHGHYDHGGGLRRFLEINAKAQVYMSSHAMRPYFNARGNYIGLDAQLADNPRLVWVADSMELGEDCRILTAKDMPRPYPVSDDGLQVRLDGKWMPDDFCHEQYLLLEENGKRICFTGCAHRGILNILHGTRPDVLVGGMHLRNMEAEPLSRLADVLRKQKTVFYTGHCTGQEQLVRLREVMGNQIQPLSAGSVICI